ncbi:MAG: zinc-finger domain-containing protein [Alphaproteobacteria bacterium]
MSPIKSEVKPQDVVWTESPTVGCDGDNQSGLGHPLVYYDVAKEGRAVCGYCGRIFRLKDKMKSVESHERFDND